MIDHLAVCFLFVPPDFAVPFSLFLPAYGLIDYFYNSLIFDTIPLIKPVGKLLVIFLEYTAYVFLI